MNKVQKFAQELVNKHGRVKAGEIASKCQTIVHEAQSSTIVEFVGETTSQAMARLKKDEIFWKFVRHYAKGA